MKKKQTRALGGMLFIVCTWTVAAANAQWHYYYFDEPQPLELDLSRVAVFERDQSDMQAQAAELSQAGLAAQDLEPTVFPGMSWVHTPIDVTEDNEIRRVVETLAAGDEFEFSSPVFFDARGEPLTIRPRLYVQFDEALDPQEAEATLARNNAGDIEERNWAGMKGVYRLRAASQSGFEVLETANRLAEMPQVRFAEPDMVMTVRTLELPPNDPLFPNQWGLHNTGQDGGTAGMDIAALAAWELELGDPDIITVVLDVGAQQDHPDLNQVPGFDATGSGTGGGPLNQCDGHGTLVSGVVAAFINNQIGVVGAAPNSRTGSAKWGISTVPCDGTFSASSSWLVDSLSWAESIGARVTNSSFSMGSSAIVTNKYSSSRANGLLHFAAAGNSGGGTISYPSSLTSVNSIAALNRLGQKASFSQFGTGLAFSAPGAEIWTTRDATFGGGEYTSASGTSFASPMAASVAALILSVDPSLTPPDVEDLMQETAMDLGNAGYDTTFGWGFVNAFEAVSRLIPFEIQFPAGTPEFVFPDRETSFLVEVVDNFGAPDPDSGLLHYAVDSEAFVTSPLVPLGSGNFEATLPALPFASVVEFFITFDSLDGRTVSFPNNAPQQTRRVIVTAGLELVFEDDFASDAGWTVTDSAGLTTGAWVRGTPGGDGSRGDPTACVEGSQCYLTGLEQNDSVRGGSTTLTSPVLGVSGAEEALLLYTRWFFNDLGSGAGLDSWVVQITDDGVNWVDLENTRTTSEWVSKAIRISDFVSLTDQVQVRYVASQLSLPAVVEAAVDAVEVMKLESESSCFPASAPLPEFSAAAKNRYLSFRNANSGVQTAVRVDFVNLPGSFSALNGTTMWVGEPQQLSRTSTKGFSDPVDDGEPFLYVAPLVCEPFFTDWSILGDVHVHHEFIVPDAEFALRAVNIECDIDFPPSFSSALPVSTSRYGDIAAPFSPEQQAWPPPDELVTAAQDLVAMIDGFLGKPTAPIKTRTDVRGFDGAQVDGAIFIGDILFGVDAVLGKPYPFTAGPPPCL